MELGWCLLLCPVSRDQGPAEGREDADSSRDEREGGPWQERAKVEEDQSPKGRRKTCSSVSQ